MIMTLINMQISRVEGWAAEWHQDSQSDTAIVLGNNPFPSVSLTTTGALSQGALHYLHVYD